MIRRIVLASSITLLPAAALLVAPAPAQAAADCQGGTSSGRCVEVLSTSTGSTVVETVPMVNNTSLSGSFTCSVEQAVSRTVETSVGVDAGVSGQIFGAVSASVSVSVSESLSQTASSASSAAGTFTLAPGQALNCQRTYGYVTATVHQYDYSGTGTSNESTYTTTVPSSLGVTVVDG
jgi:hypothetical protein